MTCDKCQRPMDYAFYINDELWKKVVGQQWFDRNVGRICAHCTLQALGGLSWYIVWNQPLENIREADTTKSSGIVRSL